MVNFSVETQLVLCFLFGCTVFFPHYLIHSAIFTAEVTEHKMCVLFSSTALVRRIPHSKKNFGGILSLMYIRHRV